MEAGAEANYLEVDPKTKIVQNSGSNFYEVNPLGLVRHCAPTTDLCSPRTRRSAICRGSLSAEAGIASGPGIDRSRLHQWLCFIGTELHKGLFVPVLGTRKAPSEMKAYVLGKGLSRLVYLLRTI